MVALQTLCLLATLAGGGDMTLLEFTSVKCEPCKSMQPTVARLASEGYPIQAIDVEQRLDLVKRFNVTGVPTFVLVANGQEVGRLVGVRTHAELAQMFAQATTQQAAAQAQDYVVRGQSPENQRRGLGLFNRLGAMGKSQQPADNGTPPMEIPASHGGPTYDLGNDPAFAQREAAVPTQPMNHARYDEQPQSIPVNAIPVSAAAPHQGSPADVAMAATVRLKVEDAGGHSFGTGTIIDTVKDEALIVTCGHIFRQSKGQGKIHVDLAGAREPVIGQLISFDLTRDIALVSIRPGMRVQAARVASDARQVVPGVSVFSIGCDHGREPSVHDSKVTAVGKYVGSPNYTVAGMPVEGRSGGGLFLADGSLIGICNAADEKDNEGLYAALPTVHWQLDQIGQSTIYQKDAGTVVAAATPAPQDTGMAPIDVRAISDMTRQRNGAGELGRDMVPVMPTNPPGVQGGQDTEVICIVRSKNQPHGSHEVIVVDQPTVELMDMLSRSRRAPQPTMARENHQPTSFTAPAGEPTIVRGQSR